MEIYDNLKSVKAYINRKKDLSMESMKGLYFHIMKDIKKFKKIRADTKIFEIGTGHSIIQILCHTEGLDCKGMDISPQLIRDAKENGKKFGIELDIELGNIENIDLGLEKYDIIIANAVFEHVKSWQKGIKTVYKALKPKGLFYFTSTNKFTLKSSELNFPFYGWLPNKLRYMLKARVYGEDIFKWGLDYHQFIYFQLRRFFYSIGFSKVFDVLDIINLKDLDSILYPISRLGRFGKIFILLYYSYTYFICIK